jgi:hypothetical protein
MPAWRKQADAEQEAASEANTRAMRMPRNKIKEFTASGLVLMLSPVA